MKHFGWQMAVDWIRRSDWPIQVGVALFVFAMVFQFMVNVPMYTRADQLRQEIKRKEGAAHNFKRSSIRPVSEHLDEFYRYFPPRQSVPNWLGKIYSASASHALQLVRGEYKLVPSKTRRLIGYQVDLPVSGSYAQVKEFVVQVLSEIPTASLDELSLKRESVDTAIVDTKIRLTLFVRAE